MSAAHFDYKLAGRGRERLRQFKSVTPDLPVIIKGDAKINYEKVIDVLDVVGKVEITQIGLVTQKIVK